MNRLGSFAVAGALVVLGSGLALARQQETRQDRKDPANQARTQTGATFGGLNQTPWFSDPGIRTQLRLTDDQFNRLNTAYGKHWELYQAAQGKLGTLDEQQRAQRLQELSGTFYKGFGQATSDVLQPEQRERFSQLWLQYRGYDAFTDPMVRERLRLTDEQLGQLRKYGQDYTTRMGEIDRNLGTDRTGSTTRFAELRKSMDERINAVLTEEQRKTWRGLVGDPYTFQPTASPLNREPPEKRPGK